jgi:lipoprotein-anchoring transpeptidase ErfK/SrfK
VRGAHKIVISSSVLALVAGAVIGVQLLGEDRPARLAITEPVQTSELAPTTTVRPTTTVPTTTPPPPPPPPPVTTTVPPPPPAPPAKPAPPKPKPAAQPSVGTPCKATARACIDLSANRSWLLDGRGNVTYGPVPITHGRAGWRTPAGTFRVGWKDIDHKSSIFDNAPMPYSVFFNGGIAFHEGSLTEQSHGCIHLSRAAAKSYYNTLRVGDVVQVVP